MHPTDAHRRLTAFLARPVFREVRATTARPAPPAITFQSITHMRLIIALEGHKQETYGDGAAVITWMMEPGDALVLRPHTWLAPRFHTAHRHLGLIFTADRLRVVWSQCQGNEHVKRPSIHEAIMDLPASERSAVRQVAEALCSLDYTTEQRAARSLVHSFLLLVEALGARPQVVMEKAERTWREALAYLQDHCHLPINRAEVATALGMSPNYLSRLCRDRNQRSFIETLNGLRLEKAASILTTVDTTVAETAPACGFTDAGYFIRSFRRSFGMTPGQFKRRRGAAAGPPA